MRHNRDIFPTNTMAYDSLHLLERSAAAANVARDGAASTAASLTRMRGVSLRSGRH